MNNKKYLLGLIIYSVVFGFLSWIYPNLELTSFLASTLMLIPALLVWLIAGNIRDKNYKFIGVWGILLLSIVLFVIGVLVKGGWFDSLFLSDVTASLLYGLFLSIPLFSAAKALSGLLEGDYKAALGWGIVPLIFIGLVVWGLNFHPSTPNKVYPTKNVRIIHHMGQIRSRAGLVFSSEKSYDKLSCKYNDEIKTLCNDINSHGGSIVIFSSQDRYCAYTSLNRKSINKENQWYCIDSTGVAKQTVVNPSQPEYCSGETFVCPPSE